MTTSMTTLALNLLISERRNHRLVFAGKIIELLQQNSPNSEDEKIPENSEEEEILENSEEE